MTLSGARWHVIAESNFAWEREALDWLRSQLPDRDPWHVWTNFEFIDDEGRVNEVDALVLTPACMVLIEMKSRPGIVGGDAQSWTWRTDGRELTTDNPLPLANRKAKRLASVLRRQEALSGRTGARIKPWVEPLIFLSKVEQRPVLDPGTAKRVVLRGQRFCCDRSRADRPPRLRCPRMSFDASKSWAAHPSRICWRDSGRACASPPRLNLRRRSRA